MKCRPRNRHQLIPEIQGLISRSTPVWLWERGLTRTEVLMNMMHSSKNRMGFVQFQGMPAPGAPATGGSQGWKGQTSGIMTIDTMKIRMFSQNPTRGKSENL